MRIKAKTCAKCVAYLYIAQALVGLSIGAYVVLTGDLENPMNSIYGLRDTLSRMTGG